MANILDFLTTKLTESSTWRGLIAIATAVGVQISPDLQAAIISAGLGLIGIINVVLKEKKKTK